MAVKRFLLLLMLAFTVMVVNAGKLPFYYPKKFPRSGAIERIDPHQGIVIINDTIYRLSDRLVVHTMHSEFDTPDKLEPGINIGFRVIGAGSGKPVITETWSLPPKRY